MIMTSTSSLLVVAAYIFTAYTVTKWIYRLYFSPIARFPGPRLAALTYWYEGWYDVVLRGRYTWRIEEMHQRYGPVVRINPCELHVSDREFYHEVYVSHGRRRTDKWDWSARMFGTQDAIVGTTDHQPHHLRKQALAPFFSKASITKMEHVIWDKVDTLRRRLLNYRGTTKVANLSDAFTAFSADVIGSYIFGIEYGFLDAPDFAPEWREAMVELSRSTHLMKQIGWASPVLNWVVDSSLGAGLMGAVYRPVKYLCRIRQTTREAIDKARSRVESKPATTDAKEDEKTSSSVLESLLSSTTHQLPAYEMSTPRLMDECITLLGAGSVTTAQALTIALYFILTKPDIESQLRTELANLYAASATPPTWSQLSQLPYLTAILNEALRLSYGVASRLPRVSPDVDLVMPDGTTVIPRGTPVSMTQMFLHNDYEIFDDPLDFDPARWIRSSSMPRENRTRDGDQPPHSIGDNRNDDPALGNDFNGEQHQQQDDEEEDDQAEKLAKMRKFFVPFSRGTRACLGTNLAWAELYCCIAGLFRPPLPSNTGGDDQETEQEELKTKLHETEENEIRVERDYFNGQPGDGCRGVRVLVQ